MAEVPALRLALAFAPAGTATLFELLWAIDAEIGSSARAGIDHDLAHARLAWWRAEIERLATGRPSHPLCRRLLALAGAAPDYAAFAARVTAAELALVGYAPAGLDELDAWFDRADGAREILAAQAIARERQPLLTAYGRALGRGLGLAGALARNDALLLGSLERGALAARARAALQEALTTLAPAERAAQRVGLVRAQLALDQLDRPDRMAAPLRQLWLAWRSARRTLRSAP